MGCGTSKPSNIVSPVPNTQTALPKGSKDSLPGKPQGSKNVDIIVVKQAGRQDTHGTHKPLKENTKRIEAADTKQDQFVRSNSVKVGSQQVVPRASNDLSATSNESNQHHVVVRKSLGDVIPLKENEAALISEEVKYEDSSEIPRGSATPSVHGTMQTELPSSEFKAVLTETPRETTTPISKLSSPKLIQEEPKDDGMQTLQETATPISGSSLSKLIQEKLKTEVREAPTDETSTTTTIFPQIICPPTTPVESKDFTEDLKQTITQLVTLAEIENGQQDNYVTEEIPQENQTSVTMETDRGESKESQSSVTMEIHRGVSKENQSSITMEAPNGVPKGSQLNVTMETDIANGKEIVTIRIEVDDELEPELQNETVVPVKGRCAGHESSMSQLACELGVCEVESTSSPSRYFPTKSDCTVRSKLTLPIVIDVVINTSDSNVDNVCRSPSLRIEKHMNEELDVYPSTMRALSPSCLSVARSVMSTSLTELKEEEEEDDNKIEQATNKTPSEVNQQTVDAGDNNIAEARVDQNLNTTGNSDSNIQDRRTSYHDQSRKADGSSDILNVNSDSNIQDRSTSYHEQSRKADGTEIIPNDARTEKNDKLEMSDTRTGDGHVTGEIPVEIENHECLNNDGKIHEAIAKESKTPASHESEHVTAQNGTPAKQNNKFEIVNATVESTNKPENTNLTSDQLSGSAHEICETKETQTGSKDGSNGKRNGSKTKQVDELLIGIENDTDETAETSQDKMKTTLPDLEAQRKLSVALRFACKALPWEHIRDQTSEGVTSLKISRSIMSQDFTVGDLIQRLVNLKELDLSNNLLGPQGFRVVCLGVAKNKTLTSLNLSNNLSDTDSSKALGTMLSRNDCLESLDVSGNDLGKDYFSRCVGPVLLSNKTIKTLKCASCGATDMTAIMDALASQQGNRSLIELDVSNNQLGMEFGKQIGNVLKTSDCSLKHLDVHGTDLQMDGLLDGIQNNTSLVEINAGGHNVRSLSFLMEFVYSCIIHPSLKQLILDNTKPSEIDQWHNKAHRSKPTCSSIKHLSLAGCSLTDDAFEYVAMETEGLLSNLSHVSLSGNSCLTVKSLQSLCRMIKKGENTESPLSSLDFSLNEADGIPTFFGSNNSLTNLKSLNLRKAKISPTELVEMNKYFVDNPTGNDVMITSLNLDQIKLSGTNFLQGMLGLSEDFQSMVPCALTSLSLSGCSLNDKDGKPLMMAIAKGLQIQVISLSTNRLTDTSVDWLVDSLHEPCSLCHLDMSNNKIRNNGAEKLASVLQDGKIPKLSTLLLSNNNIGASGITALVSKVNPNGILHGLNLKDQQQPVGEEDMDKILEAIAMSCDIPLSDQNTASKKYFDFSPQTFISLTGLGGEPGDYGPLLDSIAIQTDNSRKHKKTLSLQDALSLSAVLSNSDDGRELVMSQEEWDLIISADKDAPAWLQVSVHRKQAIYISNLPLTVTREKLDSILENDADCDLKEVFLLKDPILRKPNGLAWALFNDEESVKKAIEFYHSGQAQVYGRPFVISAINVNIAEHDGKITEDEARKEMAARDELHKAEESQKAAIVQAKFEESSARHDYAAQHPAYADGRIW